MLCLRLYFGIQPIFHEKICGGRKLDTDWGYSIPDGPIGECWAISAHPHGDCQIDGGSFDGMRLSELWQSHREMFGAVPTAEGANAQFPLLVKIIDAKGDPAVQRRNLPRLRLRPRAGGRHQAPAPPAAEPRLR